MEKKVCGAYIGFLLAVLAIALLSGCQTAGYGYGGYTRGYGGGMYFRGSAVPVPPSNIGFLYREPVGWEDNNPRSFRLKNTTDNLHGRCWVDGRQVLPTAWGQMPHAPIATQTGVIMAPMLPPQSETYIIVSVGRHHLRCQLYSGPPPYQATHELDLEFQTNTNGGRTFHLNPDVMSSARSLPAN